MRGVKVKRLWKLYRMTAQECQAKGVRCPTWRAFKREYR